MVTLLVTGQISPILLVERNPHSQLKNWANTINNPQSLIQVGTGEECS